MGDELWRKGAGELATLIRAKKVSSREVVDAHLARIDEVNDHLNAVVRVLADSAIADATTADAATARGANLGPLHGVPFTIKANIDVAGLPTTHGVVPFADAVVPIDAPIVERMRAAGAIPLARTNLPDMGLRVHTDSSLHGLTRNPWDPNRTAAGSSGGEASALASGMTPIGLGNDIGGSLRNPANACGITSIKPTTNRVPFASLVPAEDNGLAFHLMATDGPMARHVADLRLALSIIAGPHRRDPYCVPAPLDYDDSRTPGRVAVVAAPPGGETDPGISAIVRSAGQVLGAAGYDVVEITPPAYEDAINCWSAFLMNELRAIEPLLGQIIGVDGMRFLHAALAAVPDLSFPEMAAVHVQRHGIARQWSMFMDEHPIVISPTWSQPPFTHGWDIESPARALETLTIMRPALPANLIGLPAGVVPGGVSDGMPVGVQVIGRRFREDQVFAAMEVVEAAVGHLTPIDPLR